MIKRNSEIEQILEERFGKDSLIALATTAHDKPSVRVVDAFYEDGKFYVLTHSFSKKIKQIEENPQIAIAGDWFTATGTGENLGFFGKQENARIANKMRELFAAWIDNGHNNFEDENTCILQIHLLDGILIANDTRYEIDFT